MYDARTSQGVKTLEYISTVFAQLKQHKLFKNAVVYPAIPRRTDFADASKAHEPLAVYAPKHDSLSILDAIALSLDALS
jgi:chromosome partitioning protein